MNRRRLIPIVIVIIVLAGAAYLLFQRTSSAASASHNFSGTIEADEIDLTSEVSGIVEQVADEGATVKAGETLIVLNTDLLRAQLAQAQAAQQVAEANLALLKAGSRTEEIAQAQAAVDQAKAQRDGAEQSWENAQSSTVITQALVLLESANRSYDDAMRQLKNPQELDTQIIQATSTNDTAQAALTQAQINAQSARDRLSLAKTQAEAQLQQATLALTQAQARYAQTKLNYEYVQDTGNDPIQPTVIDAKTGQSRPNSVSDGTRENYYAQFVQAEAALRQAEQTVATAQASAENARQAEVTGVQAADEQLHAAQTALTNAKRALDHLRGIRANPQQIKATTDIALNQRNSATISVDAARLQQQSTIENSYAALQSAEAALSQARAKLTLAQAGPRSEQVQASEAQVAQVKAQVQQLNIQIAKATIKAPVDGIVQEKVINRGEQAAPGNILIKFGSLAKVKLTIYVPEDRIGVLHIRQGVTVQVTVDSYADRAFPGAITYIAPQAEFTPRNVQTKEERATTVFPVRIELANPNGDLKPGMAADVTIQ